MTDPGCLFCKIIVGDIPSARIDEDEHTVTFMDINPATRGHALVVPKRHYRDLMEIPPEELTRVATTAQRVAARVTAKLGADGVNLLNSCGPAAWQTVLHFHMHVIPRYADDPIRDSLRLPWVPAAGDLDDIRATAEILNA